MFGVEDEIARQKALDDYEILDTAAELAFDRLTELAAAFYQSPIALISLIDRDRQWFKSRVGLAAEETPRNVAFCHHAIQQDNPFIVNDATRDPRFAENPLVTGDPDIRFYAGAPLRRADGKKIGTLCIIDRKPRPEFDEAQAKQLALLADIVMSEMELRLKNKQLEQTTKELERANRARQDFVSMISHEIRTPLSAVVGLAEILTEAELPEQAKVTVGGIRSSAKMLSGLLNDVLDYAKIEAGKLSINRHKVNVKTFVESMLQTWDQIALEKGLKLSVAVTSELPEFLMMDELRTSQIIGNLLSNAVKFTKEGEIAVEVGLVDDPQAQSGRKIRLSVKDTGKGMTSEQLSRLFLPFEQADEKISREHGGTGLGMAITKSLLELMNGAISCESEWGVGTTFTVDFEYLPVIAPQINDTAIIPAPIESKRILVVDDSSMNRLVASHFLTKLGHQVVTVESGRAALALIKDDRFDLAFLDVRMPELSGPETAVLIKKIRPDLPLIAFTADDVLDDEVIEQNLFVDHITKPASGAQFMDVLEKITR